MRNTALRASLTALKTKSAIAYGDGEGIFNIPKLWNLSTEFSDQVVCLLQKSQTVNVTTGKIEIVHFIGGG